MPCSAPKSPERDRCRPHFRKLALQCAAALVLGTLPAKADQLWSVHGFGIKVGEMQVRMAQTGETYKGSGSFRTTGLAGVLARIHFDVSAKGTLTGDMLRPKAYKGSINTGKRKSQTTLEYSTGIPRKTAGKDAPAVPIDPDRLNGAIDPMTMMWLTLRDSEAPTCVFDQTQFDGTRLTAIRLTRREDDDDDIICHGSYDRLGGYSQAELDEMSTSPLSITYRKSGDTWRTVRVYVRTRHGPATLHRRD
ncbi:Protein of unknown function [Shimia gijangensis]|uniref:DUF3108 domain-containing protein n=1 Tax=Shimia gijangensis TaxID=1470563 RepID=A0A1M6IB58_9RHOB|nr:DUF3108 domain-containing protein [Shimia gijangensis]SHJ31712.1 Protein of unknown function [Shimia gijangensis]